MCLKPVIKLSQVSVVHRKCHEIKCQVFYHFLINKKEGDKCPTFIN